MMRHDEARERLDDFFDGALSAGEADAVAEHLRDCSECGAELEAMAALQAETRALPRAIAPSRELWPEIEARLRERGESAAPAATPVMRVDFRRSLRQGAWPRRAMLAAAAVVLVALSSATTALLMRTGGASAPVAVADPAAAAAPAARPVSGLVAFRPTEMEYLGAVRALQAELDARRGQLAPRTVAVIEENLRVIDQAIAESRAALAADPSNADLPLHLSGVYRRKVELLQSALQLPGRSS